jgi:hypothetical protein
VSRQGYFDDTHIILVIALVEGQARDMAIYVSMLISNDVRQTV